MHRGEICADPFHPVGHREARTPTLERDSRPPPSSATFVIRTILLPRPPPPPPILEDAKLDAWFR